MLDNALKGTPAENWTGRGNFPGWFKSTANNGTFSPVDPDKAQYIHRRLREGRSTPTDLQVFGASKEDVQRAVNPEAFRLRELDRLSSTFSGEQREQFERAAFAAVGNFQPGSATVLPMGLGFKQAEMIGDELLPVYIGGPDLKADYPKFGTEIFELISSKKGFGQKANRVDINVSFSTVNCDLHWEETVVEQAERDAGAFLPSGLDTVKTEVLRGLINLEKENDQFTFLTDTANYDTGFSTALTGSDRFSDPASDPITLVHTAKAKIRKATRSLNMKLWMGPDPLLALCKNPRIIDAVKYTGTKANPGGMVPPETLVALFLLPIVTGYAGAKSTFGGTLTDLWAQNAGIVVTGEGEVVAQRFNLTVGSAGYPSFSAYQDPSVGSKGATVYKYSNAWAIPSTSLNNRAAYLWQTASAAY